MIEKIFTIGYEGGSAEDLISSLLAAGVNVLIDVREMPLSRKPGLSKKSLAAALETKGIEYRHERWLGAPRPVRDALKKTRDYRAYFTHFDAYLETQRDELGKLAEIVEGSVALMCFERDPDQCHRKSVARVLGQLVDAKPRHLGVRSNASSESAPMHLGESLSAA